MKGPETMGRTAVLFVCAAEWLVCAQGAALCKFKDYGTINV